jgi:transposase
MIADSGIMIADCGIMIADSGVIAWARTLKPSMRQVHLAGEKLFVDFAGQKPALVDGTTGEVVGVELFVGVLGASAAVC